MLLWSDASIAYEPSKEALDLLALFDEACVETQGKLIKDRPPLSKLVERGVKPLSPDEAKTFNKFATEAWAFKLGTPETPKYYALVQAEVAGHQLCSVHAKQPSAQEVRETAGLFALHVAKSLKATNTSHASKPLMGNPDIMFDAYQISVPGKENPAVISVSTTDKSVRELNHEIAYEAAR